MAVAVNRDLTVQVLADANVVKLMDSKQALRAAVQKGEPKCLGFVIAGVVSILLDKYCNMNHLYACLVTSVITTVIAIMAIIVYSVDIERNPATPCIKQMYDNCDDKHYATKLSKGVKSALLLFTLAQTTISGVLSFLLFRQRRSFQIYNPLNQDAISTQAVVSADGN
ncbi:hypothetical protein NQD34_000648 [Periophthalmus magnuspinnatus]|nr:hypothetical protein NQD34_000648 [Periophthalmus magnuspinnatus]